VQYVANGYTFLVYKDNGARKVANADMDYMVSFSNTILASKQAGHVGAKEAAVVERLCPAFDPDASDSDISDEKDSEDDDEDSENGKDKGSAEDSNKIVGPVQAEETTEPPTNSETAALHLPHIASNIEKDPPPAFEESGTDTTKNIHGTAADARQDGESSRSLALRNGGSDAFASTPTSDSTLPSGIEVPTLPPGPFQIPFENCARWNLY
jgi:hypothetical protein